MCEQHVLASWHETMDPVPIQVQRERRVTYLENLLRQLQMLQTLKKLQHLKSMDCKNNVPDAVHEHGPVLAYGSLRACS